MVLKHRAGLLLIGGDSKCVMSQLMDRQPASKAPLSRMSKMLKHQSIQTSLVDRWRSFQEVGTSPSFLAVIHPIPGLFNSLLQNYKE